MIITAKSSPRPHRRAARNTSVAALEFFIPQEDCGAHSERELLRELLRYGCGRVLTAREQELIRLHYVEGQSLTAIATRQGRAVSSVSRSLRGARDKLYRFTEEAGRIGQLCGAARQQRL